MSGTTHPIEIQGLDAALSCREDESVLHAIKRARAAPSLLGCFGGGCGRCRVRLLSGEVELGPMSREHIGPRERERQIFLACRAYPRSALWLCVEP